MIFSAPIGQRLAFIIEVSSCGRWQSVRSVADQNTKNKGFQSAQP